MRVRILIIFFKNSFLGVNRNFVQVGLALFCWLSGLLGDLWFSSVVCL